VGISVEKIILTCIAGIILVVSSTSYAGVNPFKKSKDYAFGSNIAWYEHNNTAVKTGSIRDGSDTHYYHLNIDNDQLLLRLGKNDPSGELENTRLLDGLSIVEVKVDGNRLPLFEWCLLNQQNPGNKIKQNAIVVNGVCVNAGGGGDFVINLDNQTRNILSSANVLEFVVEPYGRRVKLSYSMLGYAAIMKKINKPVPAPVVAKPVPRPVVVVPPKAKPKPKTRPKAASKPKAVKMCHVRAPQAFKAQVPSLSYPCDDKAKKARAELNISTQVRKEKQKRFKSEEEQRQLKQRALEDSKREVEWENKQNSLWLSRCQKNWAKNKSPCYCDKFIDQAPPGIKSTCAK